VQAFDASFARVKGRRHVLFRAVRALFGATVTGPPEVDRAPLSERSRLASSEQTVDSLLDMTVEHFVSTLPISADDVPGFRVISNDGTGPLPIVRVMGEVDLATSEHLRDELLRTLTTSRGGAVVDLQDVVFMDAAGIATLIAAANVARSHGGQLRLRNTSRAVDRILDLFELDASLPRERRPESEGS
jgi:anti-anti-sigma factor